MGTKVWLQWRRQLPGFGRGWKLFGSRVRACAEIFSRSRRALIWDACGRRMVRAGRPAWALAFYRRATEADRSNPRLWLHQAAAALRAGDVNEAAICYRALARLRPDDPRAQYCLAGVYDIVGAGQSALEICRRAVERNPGAACLHRQMGRLLLRTGRVPEALRALQRAAELSPRHYDTHYYVGLALRRVGRLGEARGALRHALSLRPDDPKLYYALGLCCARDADDGEPAQLLLEGLALEQASGGLDPPTWPH